MARQWRRGGGIGHRIIVTVALPVDVQQPLKPRYRRWQLDAERGHRRIGCRAEIRDALEGADIGVAPLLIANARPAEPGEFQRGAAAQSLGDHRVGQLRLHRPIVAQNPIESAAVSRGLRRHALIL